MQARIYRPAKTAMSSGYANTKHWVLDFAPRSQRDIDPLMGWTSSDDTQAQVQMRFETKEAAIEYAEERGIAYEILSPTRRKPNIRPRGYGENFTANRRMSWTH